jgi:heptosyltransferase II
MNIAVFTKNWIGDVIFETPAIRVIKENFPDAHLIAVTSRRCVEILQVNPYVDEVIIFEENFFLKLKLVLALRKKQIDKAFLFHRSGTRAQIAYLGGIKERIGYDTNRRGSFLTHAITEPEEPIHDVQYFLDLLRLAGLNVQGDYHYKLYFSETDCQRAEQLIRENGFESERLIAINPGANWAPKRWPSAYFRELAHKLINQFGVQVILTGSGDDQAVANEILNGKANSQIISLCGKTTIRELGALYSMCRLVISNDTGPLHVAAGVGANVVGIFGPTQPLETAPLGSGKNVLVQYAHEGVELPWIGKYFPSPWMELISVDDVFSVIEKENLIPLRIYGVL